MQRRAIWANRYAIFDEIASGAMATVYIGARLGQVNRRRVVAVKKLSEVFAKEPEFVAMFLDEARLAARVRHPNVIETFQMLRVPGSLAMIMELVVGVSLHELLRVARERRLDPPPAVAGVLMAGTLRGLHAAHEARDEKGEPFCLVHRDVSPHNILVGKDGTPRMIDFGVAKAAGRLQETEAGMTRGNSAYMSPEQIRGKVDRRTDVYAAGVVLWEVFAGRQLFPVSSDTGLLGKRAAGQLLPPALRTVNPRVSEPVEALVMRALDLDPARRFATAEEMAAAVEATLGTVPPQAVASWVMDLAQDRIRDLEAKVRHVEHAFERGELDEDAATAADRPPGWEAALVIDAPDLDLPAEPARPRTSVAPSPAAPTSAARPRDAATPAGRPVVQVASSGTASLIAWSVVALVLIVLGIQLVASTLLPAVGK